MQLPSKRENKKREGHAQCFIFTHRRIRELQFLQIATKNYLQPRANASVCFFTQKHQQMRSGTTAVRRGVDDVRGVGLRWGPFVRATFPSEPCRLRSATSTSERQ